MPRSRLDPWHATAACVSVSSSARRSPRSADTSWRSSWSGPSVRCARCARRSSRSTTPAAWPSRPIRSFRSRCAPRVGSCVASWTTQTRQSTPMASKRSTRRPSGGPGIAAWSSSPIATAWLTWATATRMPSTPSGLAGRPSRGVTRRTSAGPSSGARPITAARSTRWPASSARSVQLPLAIDACKPAP